MEKTTVYLPAELKRRLAARARREGRSEAALIREGVEHIVATNRARPRLGLFGSGDPTLADRVDDVLAEGFGR